MMPLAIAGGLYKVEPETGGKVRITKSGGASYIIDLENQTCTCPAFMFNGMCKHQKMVDEIR